MDLIHRIKIRRPGFNAGEGVKVDRYTGFDWKAWHDLDRRMLIGRLRSSAGSSGGGRTAAKRGTAAHSGERRRHEETTLGSTVCCGVFTKTMSTRSRTQQGLPKAATTVRSEQRPWRGSGEVEPTTSGTRAQTKDSAGSLLCGGSKA
jgi:hypothetical protein